MIMLRKRARWAAVAAAAALLMALAMLPGVASAGSANSAHLTSPLGQTLGSPTQTFTWSKGTGVTAYWLYVGTNVGAYNIYNSGATTAQSATVTNLPANGSRISVRLWSLIGGAWQYNDYSFAAAQPVLADLTSPTLHAFLDASGPDFQDFQWNAVTSQGYWVYVGSTPGGSQYCNSGSLPHATTDFSCEGLPNNGSTVYVRLWTNVGTVSQPSWLYHDYSFTAAGAVAPVLTIPGPGDAGECPAGVPAGPVFEWTSGSNVVAYQIKAGTAGPGSTNIVSSPVVTDTHFAGGAYTCPAPGVTQTLYFRLSYEFGSIWYYDDYSASLTGMPAP